MRGLKSQFEPFWGEHFFPQNWVKQNISGENQ